MRLHMHIPLCTLLTEVQISIYVTYILCDTWHNSEQINTCRYYSLIIIMIIIPNYFIS